jgi:DNA polymerase III sliding clamp (beta) subunit (PCNA family)
MMGIYFDGKYFYSTDAYRMTRLKSLEPTNEKLLIPNALLRKVAIKGEPSNYCIYQGKIWFFYDDLIAFGRLLEGEFPNCKTFFERYDGMVRNGELRLVKFNRHTLKLALNRLSALRPEAPYRLDVLVRPGVLLLSVTGEEGEAIEKVECETDASGFFSVSLDCFKDAINVTEYFYFSDQEERVLYFLSETGLETLLFPLSVGEDTLERERKLLEEKGRKKVTEAITAVGAEK